MADRCPAWLYVCPVTANFPFCQLVVLDLRRLPSNFAQAAADRLLTDTFTQFESLPRRSAKLASGQTSLSRLVPLRSTKRSNRTLCRPKIDKTDSSLRVSGMRCGIFDVTGQRRSRPVCRQLGLSGDLACGHECGGCPQRTASHRRRCCPE